eukprot:TRINITY_DN1686_c0_g3_i1.p1 TRINITY_DN1686_c0_g3~~TRINITY_DN1686_c0_g3_i1.p1  ORF type:complete len:539 (+),score=74.89 TRINITY_DN1686_c0_g3_i1:143-1618(+)
MSQHTFNRSHAISSTRGSAPPGVSGRPGLAGVRPDFSVASSGLRGDGSTPHSGATTTTLLEHTAPAPMHASEAAGGDDWRSELQAPQRDTRVQTSDVTSLREMEFTDFFLRRELLMGLYELGFERPSPVQESCIPVALANRDIIARAKNGTGKTGAYVIPALEKIDTSQKKVQVLILVPTRELALQVSHFCLQAGKYLQPPVGVIVSVGGMRVADDVTKLVHDPPQVLVSTPGRVIDLWERKACDLSGVQLMCLDEADKLLSEDFEPQVRRVVRICSGSGAASGGKASKPQILMLSATYPVGVRSFVTDVMDRPSQVNLMEELTLVGVSQFHAFVDERQKVRCLHALFKRLEINQSIIFCNSVSRVELLARRVHEMGYNCFYIHSRMAQEQRNRVFHQFRAGRCRHLVCSDVFARGIDVQAVNVVINFDFPRTSETYLHRIGRSGRWGHMGLAVNFVTPQDRPALFRVEQELATEIKPLPPDGVDRALYCI